MVKESMIPIRTMVRIEILTLFIAGVGIPNVWFYTPKMAITEGCFAASLKCSESLMSQAGDI